MLLSFLGGNPFYSYSKARNNLEAKEVATTARPTPLGSPQIWVSPLKQKWRRHWYLGERVSNGIALTTQQYPTINTLPFANMTNGTMSNIYTALYLKHLIRLWEIIITIKLSREENKTYKKVLNHRNNVTRPRPYIPSGVHERSLPF